MNDKVFLTKAAEKGEKNARKIRARTGETKRKLNIFSAISVIFLTFNMFFALYIFQRAHGYCAKMHLFICAPT